MAFKNALKNLVTHFSVVWSVLVYICIAAAFIIGLSLPFILPIANAFADAGVFDQIGAAFSSLFNGGGWNGFWDGLYTVYLSIEGVFKSNSRIVSLTMFFLIFIVVLALRFVFGLHEIPLTTVLDGRMSCNAHYGFFGKFFSTLGVSVRYSLAKMPFTIMFDAITCLTLYGVGRLVGMSVALPFIVLLVLIILISFKNAMLSCWAASIVNGSGVIKGFGISVKLCFKHFGSIYSTYLVTAILMLALGLFLTVFTLGVGLVVIVPLFMAYGSYLNITEFYNKTGKRYYIDNNVFSPPADRTKESA